MSQTVGGLPTDPTTKEPQVGIRGVLAISTSVRVRPLFFFFFFFFFFFSLLGAIVLATYQIVFAGFVFNQFLSDFKNKHTAAKVL